MRVVQFVSDTERRGAQLFAVAIEGELRRRGVDVATAALAAGATGNPLGLPTLSRSSTWPLALRGLRRFAAGADVVVAHGSTTLPACAVALGRSQPWVYRSIGDLSHWAQGRVARRRVRWALGRTAGVSVLWPGLVPFVTDQLAVPAARVRVLPNAVSARLHPPRDRRDRQRARDALGLPAAGPVVAHVGALSDEKQVDHLIEAMGGSDAVLVLAGDGPCRQALEAQADTVGVEARFLGSIVDPTPVYAAADVVALASRTEGQPAVLIEAAMAARAVVAPAVGGIPDLVDDGRTGVLFSAGGGVGDLREALAEALDRAEELGEAAVEPAITNFDLPVVATGWLEWLDAVRTVRDPPG